MFERIVGVPDNQKDVATNQALDISKIAEEIHKRDGFKLLVWSVVEGARMQPFYYIALCY
jgi:hypothetical protein